MSHLIPPTLKPHLRRHRSHTSPSPHRPFSHSDHTPSREPDSHNAKERDVTGVAQSQKRSVTEGMTPRVSMESQRHSRIPHLHLHTHLPGSSGHHQSHRKVSDNELNSSKQSSSTDAPSADVAPAPLPPLTAGKVVNPTTNVQPASPTSRREAWSQLAPPSQGLRRTLSHTRSKSHLENGSSGTSYLFAQASSFGNSGAVGLGASMPTRTTRQRSTSDVHVPRPHLNRELTTTTSGPNATYNAIALAVDRGERRRQTKLLSSTKADVQQRDREASEAEQEMRKHLDGVSKEALEITRRLDYTYYNLLERVGGLVAIVGQLQGLRGQVTSLGSKLGKDMQTLKSEIDHNITNHRSTAEGRRMEKVEDLEARMKSGREKARNLSDRLETARQKLNNWETQQEQRRKEIRRRVKITWISTACFVFLLTILLGLRGMRKTQVALDDMGLDLNSSNSKIWSTNEDNWMQDIKNAGKGIPRKDRGSTSSSSKTISISPSQQTELKKRMDRDDVHIPDDVLRMMGASRSVDEGAGSKVSSIPTSTGPSETSSSPPIEDKGRDRVMGVFDEL